MQSGESEEWAERNFRHQGATMTKDATEGHEEQRMTNADYHFVSAELLSFIQHPDKNRKCKLIPFPNPRGGDSSRDKTVTHGQKRMSNV